MTKLSSAVILPAAFVALIGPRCVMRRYGVCESNWRSALLRSAAFTLGASLLCATVTIVFGLNFASDLIGPHFSTKTRSVFSTLNQYAFDYLGFVKANNVVVAMAILGLGRAAMRPNPKAIAYVVVLAGGAIAAAIHRPYWWYYELHLAVPVSWLAAEGCMIALRVLWVGADRKGASLFERAVYGLTMAMLVSYVFCHVAERASRKLQGLAGAERVSESEVVRRMVELKPLTRWVYTDRVIYAFHAGLLLPPHLAVVPLKRRLRGEITTDDILGTLATYRPELLLIPDVLAQAPEWRSLVNRDFTAELSDGARTLYVRRGLSSAVSRK